MAGFAEVECSATLNGMPFYKSKGYIEFENGVSMAPVGEGHFLKMVRMMKVL